MNALSRLLILPVTAMPFIGLIALLLWGFSFFTIIAIPDPSDPDAMLLPILSLWLVGIASGGAIKPLLVNESLLLPRFRRRLAQAALIYWLVFVGGLCIATAPGFGDGVAWMLSGVLTLVLVLGFCVGFSPKYFVAAIVCYAVFQALPAAHQQAILSGRADTWLPVVLFSACGIALFDVLRRRIKAHDPITAASPMAAVTTRFLGSPQDNQARRAAPLRWLFAVFEGGADYTLERAASRASQRPSRLSRALLFRAVLLPYDNPIGIALNALLAGVTVAFIAYIQSGAGATPALTLAYLPLLFGRMRCDAVGRNFRAMRPHLSDLYLAIAPRRCSDFQRLIYHTLSTLATVVVLNTVVAGAFILLFLPEAHPLRFLCDLGVVALAMGGAELAIQLEGPRRSASRITIGIVSLLIYLGCFFGLWLACGALGLLSGLLIAGLPILAAGGAVWWLGRDSFTSRPPAFTG